MSKICTNVCINRNIGCVKAEIKISIRSGGKFVPVLNEAPHHEDVLGSGDIAPLLKKLQ